MTKYKNTYRVESSRWKMWDYSTPWWYYVTINTKNQINWFGKIVDGKIILSELGNIADKFWKDIPNHFPFVGLDEYIIMQNHIHGIIIINPTVETPHGASSSLPEASLSQDVMQNNLAETPNRASIRNHRTHVTLGVIINQFKGSFKRWCNENHYGLFLWHSRFYDRIVRSQGELLNIRNYIVENPLKWEMKNVETLHGASPSLNGASPSLNGASPSLNGASPSPGIK